MLTMMGKKTVTAGSVTNAESSHWTGVNPAPSCQDEREFLGRRDRSLGGHQAAPSGDWEIPDSTFEIQQIARSNGSRSRRLFGLRAVFQ